MLKNFSSFPSFLLATGTAEPTSQVEVELLAAQASSASIRCCLCTQSKAGSRCRLNWVMTEPDIAGSIVEKQPDIGRYLYVKAFIFKMNHENTEIYIYSHCNQYGSMIQSLSGTVFLAAKIHAASHWEPIPQDDLFEDREAEAVRFPREYLSLWVSWNRYGDIIAYIVYVRVALVYKSMISCMHVCAAILA